MLAKIKSALQVHIYVTAAILERCDSSSFVDHQATGFGWSAS